MKTYADILGHHPILSCLSNRALTRLKTDGHESLYHKGDVIVREGDRCTSVFVERLAFGRGNSGAIPPGRYPRRVLSIGGFFYKIAEQFDMLLLFNRGHRLVAVGKRRGWRPRDAPILVDGRSISEAVLSRTFQ